MKALILIHKITVAIFYGLGRGVLNSIYIYISGPSLLPSTGHKFSSVCHSSMTATKKSLMEKQKTWCDIYQPTLSQSVVFLPMLSHTENSLFWGKGKSLINASRSGSEGSVRLLLTKNPTCSFSCPICRYAISRLNGSCCLGRQLGQYQVPSNTEET